MVSEMKSTPKLCDGAKIGFVAGLVAGMNLDTDALSKKSIDELRRHATTASRVLMHGRAPWESVTELVTFFDTAFDRYAAERDAATNDGT